MASQGTLSLKERQQQRRQKEEQVRKVFKDRKKDLQTKKEQNRRKKKTVGELLGYLTIHDLKDHRLRPAETYVPKSHNLYRQIVGLINHLFVQYPVPDFLYQACLPGKDQPAVCRRWFLTLAQGGSFPKAVKGVMTGKEAFVFLSAPSDRKILENVWWAKMKVAGLPNNVIDKLLDRVFPSQTTIDSDGRLAETIQFYARYHLEMSKATFDEITDFVTWKLRYDQQFRLKGRTASSVVKLSNEWHVLMQRAKLGSHVAWTGLGLPDWKQEAKREIWVVKELHDNKDLMNEGRKQKHCVYSYVQRCVDGRCGIFSLRRYHKSFKNYDDAGLPVWDLSFEIDRVTVEVSSLRSITQIKGPLNRPPTDEQSAVVQAWAGAMGLLTK